MCLPHYFILGQNSEYNKKMLNNCIKSCREMSIIKTIAFIHSLYL